MSIDSQGKFTWGEEYVPSVKGTASSWAEWSDGAGGTPTITGDADYGKINLPSGDVGHSPVKQIGEDSDTYRITVTENIYGSGTGDIRVYIRGASTSFGQDDASPAWELYVGSTDKAWNYVQIKLEGF